MATTTTTTITQDLIDRCFRFEVEENGKREVRYAVASRTTDGAEYLVKWDARHHVVTCNCLAGEAGITCWHMRAAVEHAKQFRAEQATIARNERITRLEAKGLTYEEAVSAVDAKLIVDGKPADDETLVRVYGPSHSRPTEAEMNRMAKASSPRPFAVLR